MRISGGFGREEAAAADVAATLRRRIAALGLYSTAEFLDKTAQAIDK